MKQKHGRWYKTRTAVQALRARMLRKSCLAATLATLTSLLAGCSELVLFNPKGPVGELERFIILTAFALMLVVVLPVIAMAIWFTRRYRIGGGKEHEYLPKWSYSRNIELAIWVIPAVIVTALVALIWNSTYRLDPYNPMDSTAKPVIIEAVSLDWKWLFIYPEENIAVVNKLVFPTGVPLAFRLTSDSVMTSFFIPQLGSQIYAMAGMQTKLHLLAHNPGTYFGQNQQFSGTGYAHMTFEAVATSSEEYSAWLDKLRQSPEALDLGRYEKLAQPTSGYPVTYFSSVAPDLFEHIIGKYCPEHGPHEPGKSPGPRDQREPEDGSRAMRGEYGFKP